MRPVSAVCFLAAIAVAIVGAVVGASHWPEPYAPTAAAERLWAWGSWAVAAFAALVLAAAGQVVADVGRIADVQAPKPEPEPLPRPTGGLP